MSLNEAIFANTAPTTHNSSICSDEGLTLETSAFQSLYGGQFTLSTPLINQIYSFDKFVYADAVRAVAVLPNLNHLSLAGKTPLSH